VCGAGEGGEGTAAGRYYWKQVEASAPANMGFFSSTSISINLDVISVQNVYMQQEWNERGNKCRES